MSHTIQYLYHHLFCYPTIVHFWDHRSKWSSPKPPKDFNLEFFFNHTVRTPYVERTCDQTVCIICIDAIKYVQITVHLEKLWYLVDTQCVFGEKTTSIVLWEEQPCVLLVPELYGFRLYETMKMMSNMSYISRSLSQILG